MTLTFHVHSWVFIWHADHGVHVCSVTWESYNAWLRSGLEKVVLSNISQFYLWPLTFKIQAWVLCVTRRLIIVPRFFEILWCMVKMRAGQGSDRHILKTAIVTATSSSPQAGSTKTSLGWKIKSRLRNKQDCSKEHFACKINHSALWGQTSLITATESNEHVS